MSTTLSTVRNLSSIIFTNFSSRRLYSRLLAPTTNYHIEVHKRKFSLGGSLCRADSGKQGPEERRFLQVVNDVSAEEMQSFQHFTKAISLGISKQRAVLGKITKVEDILQVPGVTNGRLEKLIASVAQNSRKNDKSVVRLGSLIHPRLRLSEVPSSVVCIHLQLPYVSWTKMTKDLEVVDWHTESLIEDNKTLKYDHARYQKKIWELCSQIPRTDLYILEETPLRVNARQILSILNRNYVEASLTTALTLRHCSLPLSSSMDRSASSQYDQLICSPDGYMLNTDTEQTSVNLELPSQFKHVVYKLKTKGVSEHFSLSVGGERISSLQLLRDIMEGRSEAADGVYADDTLWDSLWTLSKVKQEQRAQPLLLATTFYKLLLSDIK